MSGLQIQPIGLLHTTHRNKFILPSQPKSPKMPSDGAIVAAGTVELSGPHRSSFSEALRDLEGFSRIWLIWWFHRNVENDQPIWRPKVLPPRSRSGRKGVFATRSPHRPNPIGISCVPLLAIDHQKCLIAIGDHDLVDQTPILDIKPYIPRFDAFPNEKVGWFRDVEETLARGAEFSVDYLPAASERLAWLGQYLHRDFQERVEAILKYDPSPHRTRRISRLKDGRLRLGCENWRIYYRLDEQQRSILVEDICLRHTAAQLQHLPEGSVYPKFVERFGPQTPDGPECGEPLEPANDGPEDK